MLRRTSNLVRSIPLNNPVRCASYSFSPVQRMREEKAHVKRKRLEWQSRKRGITECDLLLGTFAYKYLADFTMDELLAYDRIINATSEKFRSLDLSSLYNFIAYDPTVTEWDLYYWFTEARAYPSELVKDVSMAADYAQEAIPGVKEMMHRIIEHSKNKERLLLLQQELRKEII